MLRPSAGRADTVEEPLEHWTNNLHNISYNQASGRSDKLEYQIIGRIKNKTENYYTTEELGQIITSGFSDRFWQNKYIFQLQHWL